MGWPPDSTINDQLDQSTDSPLLAQAQLLAMSQLLKAIAAEVTAGNNLPELEIENIFDRVQTVRNVIGGSIWRCQSQQASFDANLHGMRIDGSATPVALIVAQPSTKEVSIQVHNGSVWVKKLSVDNGSSEVVVTVNDITFDGNSIVRQDTGVALANANQSIGNNVATVLNFNTEYYDDAPLHEGVTNPSRMTIPAGYSRAKFTAQVTFGASAVGDRRIELLKNNSILFAGRVAQDVPAANTGNTILSFESPWLGVTSGDYFEVRALQDSGGALDVLGVATGYHTWFGYEMRR